MTSLIVSCRNSCSLGCQEAKNVIPPTSQPRPKSGAPFTTVVKLNAVLILLVLVWRNRYNNNNEMNKRKDKTINTPLNIFILYSI